jgi:hypothetical protein
MTPSLSKRMPYFETGSSSLTFPSCTSCIRIVEANVLVSEARWYGVCSVAGILFSTSA